MIFLIGYVIMVLNEGFVMLRHVSPIAKQTRDKLIERLGDNWKRIHSVLDYTWIVLIGIGLIRDVGHRAIDVWLLSIFWGAALCLIYVPKWLSERFENS